MDPKLGGAMTNPLARPAVGAAPFSPPPINSVEDTGLSVLWLQDLALKIIYSQGYMSGFKIKVISWSVKIGRHCSYPMMAELISICFDKL